MAITDRNLPVGTTLVATFKKERYSCQVETGEGGKTVYRLGDGRTYHSPSAAGSAVMGGTACNGWRFWTKDGEEPPTKEKAAPAAPRAATEPKPAKAPKPKPAPTTKMMKQIRRVANQHGVPEGSAKWFCSSCMASFIAEAKPDPDACPQGHPRLVVDGFDMA